MLDKTIYLGPFVHTTSTRELDICEHGAIGVDEHGRIAFIDRDVPASGGSYTSREGWKDAKTVRIQGEGFFFPGFIGVFGSTTLLSWLEKYTFPTESRFSDLSFASRVYSRVVQRILSNGTTTAAYYATTHVPATTLLAKLCLEAGQRAFIGRVCMDRLAPSYCADPSPEAGLELSAASAKEIQALDPTSRLVAPIITPRFAPSCSPTALKGLAALAQRENLRIQTHVSENVDELALVKDLFPDARDYIDVYARHDLLGDRTVLAHAIHLSTAEIDTLSSSRTKVAHCPCSNSCLSSGSAPVRAMLNAGVDVGLGTDVSGGFSPSLLNETKMALLVSRHLAHVSKDDKVKLHVAEALFLATRGGAKVLGLEEKVGAFEVGLEWDAQMVRLASVPDHTTSLEGEGLVDVYGHEEWEDRVAKWVYSGDDRNTLAVWVAGRLVHSKQ
ncbi:hypothetical protein ANO11243_021360 [Dothideomycetidae sp. 11243]|nr:hypothetical protein ANO11243_021360 [fungal sp. No.11243]